MLDDSGPINAEQKTAILNALKDLTFFQSFADKDLKKLISLGKIETFNKSNTILVEGDDSQSLHIILEGKASVHKSTKSDDKLVRLTYLESGASFGELSLICNSPRAATVISETTSSIFSLESTSFLEFIDSCSAKIQLDFYRQCTLDLAEKFRLQNEDFLNTQRLLWKKAFPKDQKKAS
jgi:cAMP-dependent protein kinase regulator